MEHNILFKHIPPQYFHIFNKRKMIFNKKTILSSCILTLSYFAFGQSKDSTQTPSFFGGVITATNNGISLIPSFTLGRPAVLFDLTMGKGRWSFDPMLRFGMDGKPWSFILWGRYKLFDRPQFKMSIGAHPSFVFRDVTVITNTGVEKNYLNAQRFFAWEATPLYFINKRIGFGINYLGSRGLTKDIVQYTTFIAFKSVMPHISLNKDYYLSFIPQVFYLKMDKNEGTYASAIVGIAKNNFPISISTIMSKKIKSEVAGKDFVWNIQLNYNINNRYHKTN